MKRIFKYFHHLSIPSHRNNYRAKALHIDFLVLLIAAATAFSLLTGWIESSNVLGFAQDIRIERLYDLTNEERVNQGMPALKYSNELALAAQNKAQHMFQHNYWAHFGGGKSPWDFILESGYSYEVAGENLAKGFMFSEGVLDGWKNSPTHYANIVRPEYDEVGFAVINGNLEGEETTLVVQMFGRRLAQVEPPVQDQQDTQVAQAQDELLEALAPEEVEAIGTITDDPASATAQPDPAALAKIQQPVVAGSIVSLDQVTFNWTFIVIGILMIILVTDLYFAHKLELIRLSGKNVAHIIFLITLIIGLLIIRNGVIL
jgi:hypothetical protein